MLSGGPPSSFLEDDYRAIEAAVMETERGRWFLGEFARRHRAAETSQALTAVQRLTAAVGPAPATPSDEPVFDLRTIEARLRDIRRIIDRANIAALGGDRTPGSAHSGALAEADTAIAAIRKASTHIQEVAYELRESGRLTVYAEALDAYALDIASACARQDVATQRLSRLARTLTAVERRITGLMANSPPFRHSAAAQGTRTESPWESGQPAGSATGADVGWAGDQSDRPPAPAIRAATPFTETAGGGPPPEPAAGEMLFLVNPH